MPCAPRVLALHVSWEGIRCAVAAVHYKICSRYDGHCLPCIYNRSKRRGKDFHTRFTEQLGCRCAPGCLTCDRSAYDFHNVSHDDAVLHGRHRATKKCGICPRATTMWRFQITVTTPITLRCARALHTALASTIINTALPNPLYTPALD